MTIRYLFPLEMGGNISSKYLCKTTATIKNIKQQQQQQKQQQPPRKQEKQNPQQKQKRK